MPDPRGLYFVINERQNRWWLYGDDRKPLYQSTDALPLPAEPQRERLSYGRRLAFRLRAIIRPGAGLRGRSTWTPTPRVGGDAARPRSS